MTTWNLKLTGNTTRKSQIASHTQSHLQRWEFSNVSQLPYRVRTLRSPVMGIPCIFVGSGGGNIYLPASRCPAIPSSFIRFLGLYTPRKHSCKDKSGKAPPGHQPLDNGYLRNNTSPAQKLCGQYTQVPTSNLDSYPLFISATYSKIFCLQKYKLSFLFMGLGFEPKA